MDWELGSSEQDYRRPFSTLANRGHGSHAYTVLSGGSV
jgi:hypothetical protein